MDRHFPHPFGPIIPPGQAVPERIPEQVRQLQRRRVPNPVRLGNARHRHGFLRPRHGIRLIRPPQMSVSTETAIEFSQDEIDARNKLAEVYKKKKGLLNPNRPAGFKAEKIVVPELSLLREIEEQEARLCREIDAACNNPDKFDKDRLEYLMKQLDFWNDRVNAEKTYTENLLKDVELLLKQQKTEFDNVNHLQEEMKKLSLFK